jgi:hypothetical protein
MLLIPNNVNQTMDFQGTDFRPMRSAKGAGRSASSAEKFGFQILIGGRLREGMSGQSAAAGGAGNPLTIRNQRRVSEAHFVTGMSQSFPSPRTNFRQDAGCRPVSQPAAAGKTLVANTCEFTKKQKSQRLNSLSQALP